MSDAEKFARMIHKAVQSADATTSVREILDTAITETAKEGDMSDEMIKKILIQIDGPGSEIALTVEQARRLRDELNELFSQPPKGPITRGRSDGFENA